MVLFVIDNYITLFEYMNGASGVLELSWPTPAGGGMLEIYGTTGTIGTGGGADFPEISTGLVNRDVKPRSTIA